MARYTLDMGADMEAKLTKLQADKGAPSKAEILRRALITYEALTNEVSKEGDRSVAISEDGDVVKEIILP